MKRCEVLGRGEERTDLVQSREVKCDPRNIPQQRSCGSAPQAKHSIRLNNAACSAKYEGRLRGEKVLSVLVEIVRLLNASLQEVNCEIVRGLRSKGRQCV